MLYHLIYSQQETDCHSQDNVGTSLHLLVMCLYTRRNRPVEYAPIVKRAVDSGPAPSGSFDQAILTGAHL